MLHALGILNIPCQSSSCGGPPVWAPVPEQRTGVPQRTNDTWAEDAASGRPTTAKQRRRFRPGARKTDFRVPVDLGKSATGDYDAGRRRDGRAARRRARAERMNKRADIIMYSVAVERIFR